MKRMLGALLLFIVSTDCTRRMDPQDSTFYFYVRENLKALDPVLASDFQSHQITAQIYEGLYHFAYFKRPLELEPLLAEGFPQVSADGKTYTIKIKKNIFFQDSIVFPNGKGRELVAADFIYSWKRLADPQNKSENYWVFKNKIVGLDEWRDERGKGKENYAEPVAGLQAPDSHTLVIRLKENYPQINYILAHGSTVVVPREVVDHYGKEIVNHAVGTGAFMVQEWIRGSRLTLVKNPKYNTIAYPSEGEASDQAKGSLIDAGKKLPLLDKVVILEIVPEQPRWLLFMKGDLDLIQLSKDYMVEMLDHGQLKPQYKDKGFQLQLALSADATYISMNTENPYLKNKKVRQAMSMAYNAEIVLEKFFNQLAVKSHGPIPPQFGAYRENLHNPYREYNVEKAKKLLAEAGYPGGKGLPVFNFEMSSTNATARQMSEFLKQQMAEIGVQLKLTPNTWPQFVEKVKKKKADMFEMAWNADYPDAENFLQLFYSKNISPGPNNANFSNAEFDRLFEKASTLQPGAERTQLYQQMEDLLIEECPWIFNVHRLRALVQQPWLRNSKDNIMVSDFLKYYKIEGPERAHGKQNL